jgi:acetyl esterase/lipase
MITPVLCFTRTNVVCISQYNSFASLKSAEAKNNVCELMKRFAWSSANFVLLVLLAFSCASCAFKAVSRTKGITYLSEGALKGTGPQKLNVFAPKKSKTSKSVLVFIHGGSWNSGKRSLYNFFGNRLARKGVVTVIIDYPLSPAVTYYEMAQASAEAINWTKQNIGRYGGEPERIFISGHSAGGHIAALLTVDDRYFDSLRLKNPLAGAILIDAAGLDMFSYLTERKLPTDHSYIRTFTNNPEEWKAASPIYHLHDGVPPIEMFIGERTYPSLVKANRRFYAALSKIAPNAQYTVVKRKKHIPMITQFFWTWNPMYDQLITFMNKH